MRYLAIDPGGKRMGLAVGSDLTGIATPLEVVQAGNDMQRLTAIERAIEDQGPDALVIGLPLNMDGTEGPGAKAARKFAQLCLDQFNLPIYLADERLSSYTANQQMSRSGLTRGQKKSRRDALAAAAILRAFLEQRKQAEHDSGEQAEPPPMP